MRHISVTFKAKKCSYVQSKQDQATTSNKHQASSIKQQAISSNIKQHTTLCDIFRCVIFQSHSPYVRTKSWECANLGGGVEIRGPPPLGAEPELRDDDVAAPQSLLADAGPMAGRWGFGGLGGGPIRTFWKQRGWTAFGEGGSGESF